MSNFSGPFKEVLQSFIETKKSLGYKYLTEVGMLKRFDRFTEDKYSSANTLTKEIVLAWCSKTSYEKQNNLCGRASIIRQLAIHLDNIGIDAYILPKNHFKSGEKYVPYIYSKSELQRFISETDKCHFTNQFPHRHLIMPVIFRMVYTCGLRISEARLLKVQDVDLTNGILTINQSKMDNSRFVPMADELTEMCRQYTSQVHIIVNSESYFFPMKNGRPVTLTNVYKNFRKFLWRAGISHGGRGFGPRIHDFRHVYVIHSLKKWSEEGKDLMVYLPILRTYLGHKSFAETAYYLRLTADVFPDITLKLERAFPDLIPIIEGGENESN